jgi:hypothetical protein
MPRRLSTGRRLASCWWLALVALTITVGGCGGESHNPTAVTSATPTPSASLKSGAGAPTRAFPVL